MTKSSKYDILNNMKVREEIKILGEQIRIDIENMPRKILDIDLIEEKSSDFTFFEIDEDENKETYQTGMNFKGCKTKTSNGSIPPVHSA